MKENEGDASRYASVVLQAEFKLGVYIFIMFVVFLIQAFFTFPFVGYTSSVQNVLYGLVVGALFYLTILVFIITIRHEQSLVKRLD